MSLISPEVLQYMQVIRELLNTTEAQQIAFIHKLEVVHSFDFETIGMLSSIYVYYKFKSISEYIQYLIQEWYFI